METLACSSSIRKYKKQKLLTVTDIEDDDKPVSTPTCEGDLAPKGYLAPKGDMSPEGVSFTETSPGEECCIHFEMTSIESLPEELLLQVFSYVPVETLVMSVRHVSKRWRDISHDWLLWQDLALRVEPEMPITRMCEVLRNSPLLRHVIVPSFSPDLPSVIENLCCISENIVTVDLGHYQFASCNMIEMIRKHYDNLEYLSVQIDEKDVYAVKQISLCKSLKTLKLWTSLNHASKCRPHYSMMICVDSGYRWPIDLRMLADGCPALKNFHLETNSFGTMEQMTYLMDRKKDTVRTLAIMCRGISLELLLLCLECPNLQSLTINTFWKYTYFSVTAASGVITELDVLDIEYETVHQLLDGIDLTGLKKLVLRGCAGNNVPGCLALVRPFVCPLLEACYLDRMLRDLCVDQIIDLQELPNLQTLYIQDVEVTEGGMRDIAMCKTLSELTLYNCQGVTDAVIDELLQCSSVTSLNLEGSRLLTGRNFHLFPTRLPLLKVLNVTNCRIEERYLSDIRGPDLEIVTD